MKNALLFQRANRLLVRVLALVMFFSCEQLAQAAHVTITQQPHSTNVLAGSNANFTVVASGTPPLRYRWSFNGTNLTNGGRISGATNATLTVSNVVAGDAGPYRVVVTNGFGSATSSIATLTVLLPPSITTQPTNQSVLVNSNVTFSAAASGTGPLFYQWQKDDVSLSNGGNVSGATSSTLNLSGVQTNDTGSYQLVVTNNYGSATSLVATLTVVVPVPPSITAQPANLTTLPGYTASFSISAAGTEPLLFQWEKDGNSLANDGRLSGTTSQSLTISNLQASDAGGYLVIVSNAYGSVTSTPASLLVLPIAVWGEPEDGGMAGLPPTLTNVLGIAAQRAADLGLKSDGTAVGWGDNSYGQTNVPVGLSNIVEIAVGHGHDLALGSDGSITGWGDNIYGESVAPVGLSNVVSIGAGYLASVALKSDGTIVGWGYNSYGEPPAGLSNIVAIAVGVTHALAIKDDGSITGWGDNSYGESVTPAGLSNVVAVAAGGDFFSMALRSDGTVVQWGANPNCCGQINMPAGLSNVIAITAGYYQSLALKNDGTVSAWGGNYWGEASPPGGLSNVVAVAAGYYHSLALVQNPAAQVPPLIRWVGQTNRTIPTGHDAVIIPLLSGSLPMSFQWYFNGSPLSGQTNKWLALASLQSSQSGNYQLIVSNNYGSATSPVTTITIGQPPTIVLQPTNQSVVLGNAVTFGAVALGDAPLGYQWWFNGTPLMDNGRVNGSTSTNLTIANIQTNDAGTYQLVATNRYGTATSTAATLTVLVPAYISSQPTNLNVLPDSNASFSVTASGSTPLNYLWYSNGVPLANGGRISGATSATLTITDVQTNDCAAYQVVVTNICGTATSSVATLTIIGLPIISAQPASRAVPAGTNVSFSVTASGLATLYYQWRFDGAELSGKTNASLSLTNVQSPNAGDYDVVITNVYGAITSVVVTLTVLPAAPVITTQAVSRVASVGQNVSLIVAARGSEPMSCQWLFNGTNLPGANAFTLTWSSVNSSLAGTYRAAVSNAVGSASTTNITLTVSPVIMWGLTNPGQTGLGAGITIPATATNVIAIVAGGGGGDSGLSCMALRGDGTLVRWGNSSREIATPSNAVDVVAMSIGVSPKSAGNYLALRSNGTLVNWTSSSTSSVPAAITNGNIVAVAAGGAHQLALRDDGTVFAWGNNASGQTNVPSGATNVIAIAAGDNHCLALRADGMVIGWGLNTSGQATALSNAVNVVAITAGGNQSMALLADGTVVGRIVTNTPGAAVNYGPPTGDISNKIAIAAGVYHSLAIGTNRTINGWGATNYGQITIPAYATNVLAIAAGGNDSLALVRDPFAPPIPPRIGRPPLARSVTAGQSIVLNALAVGGLPLRCQWYRDGEPLAGKTNQWLAFGSIHPGDAGGYQLVAMNDFGSTTSAVAVVTVNLPQPALKSPARGGGGFQFSFNSISGVIYVVEFTGALGSGTWTELERRFGIGGLEIVTDASAGGGNRFYRVRALYAPSPKLVAATWSGGSVNFSFATVAGAQYVVECTDQLAPPQWHELQTIAGTGSSVGFTDPAPAVSQRFYRLRVK
jgi:alpha-tubulin suppressor-like RCC1 family protein